jgi:hypothetical protein
VYEFDLFVRREPDSTIEFSNSTIEQRVLLDQTLRLKTPIQDRSLRHHPPPAVGIANARVVAFARPLETTVQLGQGADSSGLA